jgi:DNA-binding NarL/FixJ family response regulator
VSQHAPACKPIARSWHHPGMRVDAATNAVGRGEDALRAGDWAAARTEFEAALLDGDDPAAHDGLGRALWWLGELDAALDHRERSYVGFRKGGDATRAARIALWLSREYLEALGNEPASNGWLARARGLLADAGQVAEQGWLDVTLGDRAMDPATIRSHGQAALRIARDQGDADLEASALAVVGRASVLEGDLDAGMTALDEAMTIATSGEVGDPLVFGDICCILTRACEEAGELGRLMRWNEVVLAYLKKNHHAPLIQWCGTCGAEVYLAVGDIATSEACLVETISGLEQTGHRSRCVSPNVKLAELRLLQGRVEEAERLLKGFEDVPEATRAAVALQRMNGDHTVAAALLLRRLNQVGDTVAAVPLLSLLVEVRIDEGRLPEAEAAAERLRAIADRSGHARYGAIRDLAAGRVARARGDRAARQLLEAALTTFIEVDARLEAARARLELALSLEDDGREVALRDAATAIEEFERVGAVRDADAAAAVVRRLGGPARTGPKAVGLLSRREREVLDLLGEGLSNAEIASRLYISTKTAGNHVSNLLAKLGLRSRAEAAAFVVRNPSED